jgi:hypothetical protein
MSKSLTGSTSPSTWVMSGSSKVRHRWNIASQAYPHEVHGQNT